MGDGEGSVEEAHKAAVRAAEDVADLIRTVDPASVTAEGWLRTTGELGVLNVRFADAVNHVSVALGLPSGARDRILRYLQLRVGEVVEKEELDGVAGIQEWARRVRELRVEYGWPISSDENRDDLRPGQYVLERSDTDDTTAARWRVLNRIRRQPGGARERILQLLLESVGQVVSMDEIAYVSKIREAPRRIRELEEAGYQIQSSMDDPTLKGGERKLVSTEKLPPRQREAIKRRYEILDRDGRRCRDCGGVPGNGLVLQVHHEIPVHVAPNNDPENLVTLCQLCHAGRHAIGVTAVADELLHPELDPSRTVG